MNTARRVVKNTTVLLAGRVFSLGIGIVYVAVLARYVHAAGMGKIATATSTVSLLSLIANFGLGQLIVRDVAGDRAKAAIYFSNTLLLRAVLSIVFLVALVAVAGATGYPTDTTLMIYIYCFAYIFDMLADVAFSIFNAYERLEYQALILASRDIINVVLSLAAIFLRADLITIVLISAFADLVKLLLSLAVLRWKFVKPRLQIDQRLCRQLLVAALPFAALLILQLINRQIDTVLLSLFRPAEEVGWFSVANALITYLLIFPNVLLQVIFPVFSRFHVSSRKSLQRAYSASFRYLVLIGFPLCAGTIATADRVIALVYGPGFGNAAVALGILALMLFWMFGFANGALLNATGAQGFSAAMAGISAVLNVVVALLLIPRSGFVGASIAAVASGAVFFFPITLICHRRLGLKVSISFPIKTLVSSMGMGVIVALSLRMGIDLLISIFAIAPIVYGMLLLIFRAIGHEDIVMLASAFRKRSLDAAHAGEIPVTN